MLFLLSVVRLLDAAEKYSLKLVSQHQALLAFFHFLERWWKNPSLPLSNSE